ncbi:hypothetical protein TSUD_374270 [Trifolium subterraneum]|uniref:Uncharacterized protein n=1 Tax=Trifolium subterraneum TaxID=3900 RepID=A0A2Z6NYR7_TRISU|nr:hypothetical protein TSUD_374270 [Trifolium subterraneum]
MPHRSNSWHSSPPLISPPLLIIILPILALTLLFLTVPPLLSTATTILQHTSLKTNWNMNSLNILLVVLAILFGIFSRKNDDDSSSSQQQIQNDAVPDQNDAFRRGSVSESQQWYGFSSDERKVFDESSNQLQSPVTGVNRLRRSSSSYPDLRQIETGDDRYKFRFFDDFEIEKQFRSPARATFSVSDHRKRLPEYRSRQEELQEVHVKEIPVDTLEIRSSSPVMSRSPPSPPPPPSPLVLSRRRSNQMRRSVDSRSEITEVEDQEFTRLQSRPDNPPPPPSLSPPRLSAKTRSEKTERRKSNVKREIAMVWASVLSNQRKRKKKQRQKNDHNHRYDNVEELTNNTTAPLMTPPPPPPPPPPSVFQSIFRKGLGKNKKIYSVPAPPPPPPPSRRSSRLKNQIPPPPQTPPPALPRGRSNTKPPLPNKSGNLINETVNAGNQSPLIPVPPPLPPFKLPAMKFVVRGDFVKIRSNQSSRSTSPEREHIDVEVSETTTVTNAVMMNHNGNVTESVFCPSPDVNAKAATFIARLRGEWRLQKLNSIKEKGNASLPLARD